MGSSESKAKELRVVVIGGVNAKKDEVIEAIRSHPDSEVTKSRCETGINICWCLSKPQRHPVKIKGLDMVLFDTPGLNGIEEQDPIKEIKKCFSRSARHVFLFVLEIEAYTKGKKEMVELIKSNFGTAVTDYMVIVFKGEQDDPKHERQTRDDLIESNKDLKTFAIDCSKRCVCFYGDNADELVETFKAYTDRIIRQSEEKCYTHKMMMAAQREVEGKEKLSLPLKLGLLFGLWIGALLAFLFFGKDFLQAGGIFGGGLGGIMGMVGPALSKRIKERL